MPRVKFSALVSAMAGKSQGSVFSKNQGGSYFRNNKSGYGTKTIAQAQNQAKFKSVGRQWSALSDVEREAWNSAVVNFPTKNIFGDSRNPSGYELFCRVNGARVSRDMGVTATPIIPQEVPGIDSLSWDTPDLFLYQPAKGLYFNNTTMINGSFEFVSESLDQNLLLNTFSICFALQFSESFNISELFSPNFSIRVEDSENGYPAIITFEAGAPGSVVLRIVSSQDDSGASGFTTFTINQNDLKGNCFFVIANKPVQRFEAELFLNGVEVPKTDGSYTIDFSNLYFDLVKIKGDLTNVANGFQLTDLRVYQSALDMPDSLQLARGYVSGVEAFITQFGQAGNSFGKVFSSLEDFSDFVLVDGEAKGVVRNVLFLSTPLVILSGAGSVASDFVIDVVSTRPVSSGVGLKSSDYLKVSESAYQENFEIDVSNSLASKFGYFSQGNDFNIAIRLFDVLSGVVYQPAPANKPARKPRFKAGSELITTIVKK